MAGKFHDCEVDDAVIRRARRGDPAAHETIYRTFAPAVYNLALRLLQQPAGADEISQDTFIEVLTRIDTFRGEAPIGAWIREIAVNKCLMQFRSGWHRRVPLQTPHDEDGSSVQHMTTAFGTQPEHIDVEKALAALAPITRAVVWLHDVEGYTHSEIARAMGKSVSFSKSQLARAHQRLQNLLGCNDETQACMQVSKHC